MMLTRLNGKCTARRCTFQQLERVRRNPQVVLKTTGFQWLKSSAACSPPKLQIQIHRPRFFSATRSVDTSRCLVASMGLLTSGLLITHATSDQWLPQKSATDKPLAAVTSTNRFEVDAWLDHLRASFTNVLKPIKRELQDDNRKALAALIAANTVVFGLWRVSLRRPMMEMFMWRHFACSYQALAQGGRFHTLLTSAFSHITLPHFAINMFMLWEFGRHVLAPSPHKYQDPQDTRWYSRAVANSRFAELFRSALNDPLFQWQPKQLSLEQFMTLYMGSALSSSTLGVLVARVRGTSTVFSIGASGAVMGVLTLYCLMYPDRQLLLFGLVQLSAAEMLNLMTAVNCIGAAFQSYASIDFVGHLGGQMTGYAFEEYRKQHQNQK